MKRVAMVGMPNSGKSTLFNRLTGARAKVGNWPGLTVDLLSARLPVGDQLVQLVDLPGIYDLRGYSEDERVVTGFLATSTVDLLLCVMNAAQIARQRPLLEQVLQCGLPVLVVLNMADEARALGVQVDAEGLAAQLGVPVCLLSARRGEGMDGLQTALRRGLAQPPRPQAARVSHAALSAAMAAHVQIPVVASHGLTERLDRVLLHRWLGLPVFFAVMLLLFELVFALGKPLQDGLAWAFANLRTELLDPGLSGWPDFARGLLLDGVYGGLTTVASFVPVIVLFFVFMGLVEDAGYLSRAAFLMDALMSRFGLDGRSFVMLLMGFGCNVPALMGARVIRSRGLRLLTLLVVPMSLCSARMQVFVFFIAALFDAHTGPLVLFLLYVASLLAAMITALVFRRHYVNDDAFALEMPPYRFPTLRHILLRGWSEVSHFLRRATRFIIAGVVLVWLLTNLPVGVAPASAQSWAGRLGALLDPVLAPLGIGQELGIALLFGFVAKEIVIGSLAVIYQQEGAALVTLITQQIDWVQGVSFMLFALIYTPCLSTIATLRSESGSRAFTALALAWSLALAWVSSFCFHQVARWLGA